MNILYVSPDFRADNSGVAFIAKRIAMAMCNCSGCEVELHGIYAEERDFGCPVFTYHKDYKPLGGLAVSRSMLKALKERCRHSDIIHSNGMWMMVHVYPAWAKRGTKCKLVYSPHGSLSPWAMRIGRVKKFIFGHLWQYPALRAADMFHATTQKEFEEIRAAGYKQPVAIVPIGMDEPAIMSKIDAHDERMINGGRQRKVVFIGRIHAIKAIDRLLLAWKQLSEAGQTCGWVLEIAGPDCGAQAGLEKLIATHDIPRVSFVGIKSGEEKDMFLATSDICVLPSKTENFGVTVTESLACGMPVIASCGTPWQCLNEYNCGKWGFDSVDELARDLQALMSMSDKERHQLGLNGRKLIRERYSWESVGRQMVAAYEWICHGGPRPACVVE